MNLFGLKDGGMVVVGVEVPEVGGYAAEGLELARVSRIPERIAIPSVPVGTG